MMGDDDDRPAGLVEFTGEVEDRPRALVVLSCRGLVKNQYLRIHGKDGGDDDATAISLAEGQRVMIGGPFQFHFLQGGLNARFNFAGGELQIL